jgi:hypothetical protein
LKSVNAIEGQEVRFIDKDRPTLFDEPTKVVTKVVTNELAATIILKVFHPLLHCCNTRHAIARSHAVIACI